MASGPANREDSMEGLSDRLGTSRLPDWLAGLDSAKMADYALGQRGIAPEPGLQGRASTRAIRRGRLCLTVTPHLPSHGLALLRVETYAYPYDRLAAYQELMVIALRFQLRQRRRRIGIQLVLEDRDLVA